MRAVTIRGYGGLDRVQVETVPRPVPRGPHDVVVALRAAALNHLDLYVIGGLPGTHHDFPHVLGADGAGVVEAVGPAVTRVKPGELVMLNPGTWCGECRFCRDGEQGMCERYQILGEHRNGTYAEAVLVSELACEKLEGE